MEKLIESVVQGTPEGWNEFLTSFSRLLYKVFCSKSFGFSREEIEEIFNDYLMGLIEDNYKKLRQFEGRNQCSLASYLKKIAINLAIDRKKKLLRSRMASLYDTWNEGDDEGRKLIDKLDSGTDTPEGVLMTQEESEQFLWALYQLDPSKLLVMLLIVYHDFDREALGKMLKTSRQNIDVIFNRSKEQIRKILRKGEKAKPGPCESSPWKTNLLDLMEKLAFQDRDTTLRQSLEKLSLPEELLIGVIFINQIPLNPIPARIEVLLKQDCESSQSFVEKTLKKILIQSDSTHAV
jgi:RNA polymerase sigma factor (sigma-70 family)